MAVQIASVSCLMVVIVVMIWVLMVDAPRKVASLRTEQWRQRSWVGAPITQQTPLDPEPPMPPDPPPPPDQCGPWALLAEVERLRAELTALGCDYDALIEQRDVVLAEVERLRAERDALIKVAECAPDILASPRGWDRGETDRYDVDDEDIHGLRAAWDSLPATLRAAIEAGEPAGGGA